MPADPYDLRLHADLLLRTQHAWIRERFEALAAEMGGAPEELGQRFAALHAAVRVEMAEEEGTLLPYVEARSCRTLADPRRVEALVDELRAGHLRLDDLALRVGASLAGAGPLAEPLRGVLDDLAEHHLEEASRLLDVLSRLAREGRIETRSSRRGTRLARNRPHDLG